MIRYVAIKLFYFLFLFFMLRKITTKWNEVNFYAWKGDEVSEVVKKGGLYYLAHLEWYNLIVDKEPLQLDQFYLDF